MVLKDYGICCVCGQRDLFDCFTVDGKPRYTSVPHTWTGYACKQCQKEQQQTANDFKDTRGESGSWESMVEYFEEISDYDG